MNTAIPQATPSVATPLNPPLRQGLRVVCLRCLSNNFYRDEERGPVCFQCSRSLTPLIGLPLVKPSAHANEGKARHEG